jgi:hypothetical protein
VQSGFFINLAIQPELHVRIAVSQKEWDVKATGFSICFLMFIAATASVAQTKIAGTSSCGKPNPHHAVDIGDRAGHVFSMDEVKCKWMMGMQIENARTTDDVVMMLSETTGNSSHERGYIVTKLDSGDMVFARYSGTTRMRHGVSVSSRGIWSYTGGSGKMDGLAGKGTFTASVEVNGSRTYQFEGRYSLPSRKSDGR